MWASAGPGPSSNSPKQWKSERSHGCVKIYNSVSTRIGGKIASDEIQDKKNYRQQYKSTRVSALTGSVHPERV